MGKFIKILGIFLVIIFVLTFVGDLIISKGLRKSDLRQYQAWNDIYNSKIKSDWIILGNSRAWCSYNPYVFDSILNTNSYNLGIVGCPINYQLIRYNTLIRFNSKPKYIIQNVDLFTFDLMTDAFEREQFFPYFFDDSLINVIAKDKKINFANRYFPLLRYYGYRELVENGFRSFFGNPKFEDGGMYKGFRGNTWTTDFSGLNKIGKLEYAKDPNALLLFNQFLNKCKNDNVKVILVSAPLYYKLKSKINHYSKLNSLFTDIADMHDIDFIDYTNDSICNDSTCFYNALHLNKTGAKKFSIKLAQDLKKLGY